MDATTKMTKQGVRDLNSYGPGPAAKKLAAEAAASLAEGESALAAAAPSAMAPGGVTAAVAVEDAAP
jgi:hypothetical protein